MSVESRQGKNKFEAITPKQCLRIRAAYDMKVPRAEIAARFRVSETYISRCGMRKCKHQEGSQDE